MIRSSGRTEKNVWRASTTSGRTFYFGEADSRAVSLSLKKIETKDGKTVEAYTSSGVNNDHYVTYTVKAEKPSGTLSSKNDIIYKLTVSYADVRSLDDNQVYRMFYPDKHLIETMYRDPDYEYVHRELRKVGVTLKLLWEEYKDKCEAENAIPLGYTKYCDG